jgi:tetratricopeptide (TPR) repeat protein
MLTRNKRSLFAGIVMLACGFGHAETRISSELKTCTTAPFEQKIDACSKAIDVGRLGATELASARNYRGLAWFAKGDLKKAHADFEAAIRANPDDAWAYNNRGVTHLQMGEIDAALADLDSAIRLKPKYAYALANRGTARLVKGDTDRAISDLDAAIALRPPQVEVALKGRADAQLAKGGYALALADYDAALKLRPDYANALIGRGYTRFCQGAFDAAAADFILARRSRADAESAFGLLISSLRANHDGKAELAEIAKDYPPEKGMPAGLALFADAITPDQALQAVSDPDPLAQRRRSCALQFQVGEWYLIHDEKARSRLHLNLAREACDKSAPQFASALAELSRLK